MFKLIYYKRPNGEEPVTDWLDTLEKQDKAEHKRILSKLYTLQLEGFKLLNTEMFLSIKGHPNMFEVRGGKCRVLVYYDGKSEEFVLLHGFRKKQRAEPHEIETGCIMKDEYLSNKYGGA